MTRKSVFGTVLLTAALTGFTVLGWAASPDDSKQPAAQPAGAAASATAAPPAGKSDNKSLHHSDEAVADPEGPAPAAGDHQGFLDYYCGKCHNATDWAGGVAFDTMDFEGIPDEAK